MTKEIFNKLTNKQTIQNNDIIHTTVNYVDDSTSVISSKTATNLQTYLDNYYKLLESYYNINFLKINPDKTKCITTHRLTHTHTNSHTLTHTHSHTQTLTHKHTY